MSKLEFEEIEDQAICVDYVNKCIVIEAFFSNEKIGPITIPIDLFLKHFAIPINHIKHCYSQDAFVFLREGKRKAQNKETKRFIDSAPKKKKLFKYRRIVKIKKQCELDGCENIFETNQMSPGKYCSKECANENFRRHQFSGRALELANESRALKAKIKEAKKNNYLVRTKRIPPKIYELKCKHCGKNFETRRKDAKYCSLKCTGLAFRTNKYIEVICLNCNKIFETKRLNQKFCCFDCYKEYKPIGSKD